MFTDRIGRILLNCRRLYLIFVYKLQICYSHSLTARSTIELKVHVSLARRLTTYFVLKYCQQVSCVHHEEVADSQN